MGKKKCYAPTDNGDKCDRMVEEGRCWQHDEMHTVIREIAFIRSPSYSTDIGVLKLLPASTNVSELRKRYKGVEKLGEVKISSGKNIHRVRVKNSRPDSEKMFFSGLGYKDEVKWIDAEEHKLSGDAIKMLDRYEARKE